jgi:gas vesicle protein
MAGEMNGGVGTGGALLAFLGGAALGVTAALLLAPQSGAESRAQIGDAVGDTKDQVRRARLAAREAASAAREAFTASMRAEPEH